MLAGMGRRVRWLTIYVVAMAYVESAVVVYLRALYYPHGFDFPLATMPPPMAALASGRDAPQVARGGGAGRRGSLGMVSRILLELWCLGHLLLCVALDLRSMAAV